MIAITCACGERLPAEGAARCPGCGREIPTAANVRPGPPPLPAPGAAVSATALPPGAVSPASSDFLLTCPNPYCAATLATAPNDGGRKARCPACRCPFVVPLEATPVSPAPGVPVLRLALPPVDAAGPVRLVEGKRPSLWLMLVVIVFTLAVFPVGVLLDVDRWGVPIWALLAAVGVGLAWFFFLYYRWEAARRGELSAFPELRDAADDEDLAHLIDALAQTRRGPRIAACRALIDLGPDAAPAVPALLDVLWGKLPLEAGWTNPPPPKQQFCAACGDRLRFWNRDVRAPICGPCGGYLETAGLDYDACLPPRAWAARALGAIGPAATRAIPALEAVARHDRATWVSAEAKKALLTLRR